MNDFKEDIIKAKSILSATPVDLKILIVVLYRIMSMCDKHKIYYGSSIYNCFVYEKWDELYKKLDELYNN